MKDQIFMRAFIRMHFCKIFYRVKYVNIEKLQSVKRCVICPNHTTNNDAFWIYNKTSKMFIMAKSDLFKNKFINKLWKRYRVFPVDRGKVDVKSTLQAANVFKENEGEVQLLMFPEGKVIKDVSEIGVVKNGAVYTAANAGVPIVPVHITRRPPLFGKVVITIGDKMDIDKSVLESKDKIREKSKELLRTIYAMEGLEVE